MKTLVAVLVLSSLCLDGPVRSEDKRARGGHDIFQVGQYSVRILRLDGNSYGYEISSGPEVLLRQKRNPFTGSIGGFRSSEDALKTATWLVNAAYPKERLRPQTGRPPETTRLHRPIPRAVAHDLGITLD